MKRFSKIVMFSAISISILGAAVVSVPSIASPSWRGVGHKLKIKFDGPATKSYWVAGTIAPGYPLNRIDDCIISTNTPYGWVDNAFILKNGTKVKVVAWSSENCTNGYRREKIMTVPNNDGLDYMWFTLY